MPYLILNNDGEIGKACHDMQAVAVKMFMFFVQDHKFICLGRSKFRQQDVIEIHDIQLLVIQ